MGEGPSSLVCFGIVSLWGFGYFAMIPKMGNFMEYALLVGCKADFGILFCWQQLLMVPYGIKSKSGKTEVTFLIIRG